MTVKAVRVRVIPPLSPVSGMAGPGKAAVELCCSVRVGSGKRGRERERSWLGVGQGYSLLPRAVCTVVDSCDFVFSGVL